MPRTQLFPPMLKIVFSTGDQNVGGSRDLFMTDLSGTPPLPLAESFGVDGDDHWFSPDGNTLIVSGNGLSVSYDVSTPTPSSPTVLLSQGAQAASVQWAPDGSGIAYQFNGDLYWMDLSGATPGAPSKLNASATDVNWLSFSPDRGWLGHRGEVAGTSQVFLTPFAGGPRRQRLS